MKKQLTKTQLRELCQKPFKGEVKKLPTIKPKEKKYRGQTPDIKIGLPTPFDGYKDYQKKRDALRALLKKTNAAVATLFLVGQVAEKPKVILRKNVQQNTITKIFISKE